MYVFKINDKQTYVITDEYNDKWTLVNAIPKQNIGNDIIEALGKLINALGSVKELKIGS
jgi:hypothetical protein